MAKIKITPLGSISGTSAKTGKDYKFYRYLLANGKIATSPDELAEGDKVVLAESNGYFNLLKGAEAPISVELLAGKVEKEGE